MSSKSPRYKIFIAIVFDLALLWFLVLLRFLVPFNHVIEFMKGLGELGGSYALPFLILIIMLVFRRELRDILSRVEQWEGFGFKGKIRVPSEKINSEAEKLADEVSGSETPKWVNTGDLFWLGHDFMLALVVLQYDDPRDELVTRLKQCHYHSSKLRFGKIITEKLLRLKKDVQTSLKNDWTSQKRIEFSEEISRLLQICAKLSQNEQNKNGDPFAPWEGYPERSAP